MTSQKGPKQRLDPHADSCFSWRYLKKAHFKKILLCLAIAQVLGILYLYHQNRGSPTQKQEPTPSPETSEEVPNTHSSVFHLPLTQAKDMSRYYVEVRSGIWCLATGAKSERHLKGKCDCLDGWKGLDCGIPPAVWNSEFIAKGTAKGVQIKRRHHPRRLIYSIVYNGEFELLNHTLTYLGNIVEAFLIGEVKLSETIKLSTDLLPQFAKKIVYISLEGLYVKVDPGNYMSIHKDIWMKGKKVMSDFRPDDIVILTDVSSIPSKEVLTFLKLYDGFSEPIQFKLATAESLYNTSVIFNSPNRSSSISADLMACTFEYLRYLCVYDASLVWFYEFVSRKEESLSFQNNNWPLQQWTVGSSDYPAGMVCHTCMPVVKPVINTTAVLPVVLDRNITVQGIVEARESNHSKVL